MEHFRRGVEFGMASSHRSHSLSCQMAESMQMDAQNAVIRSREKSSRLPRRYYPAEIPVIPKQAMEFLSRTWSPSSSDLFEILSPNSLRSSLEDRRPGEAGEDDVEEKSLDGVAVKGGKREAFNQTWRVLAGGNSSATPRKHKLIQHTWLNNIGHIRALGDLFSNISSGCRRRKKREELRLHSAQTHAAVSVAQLAAAIAGIVSDCELRPSTHRIMESDKTMLASAAALVATVCAEAAEAAGANRARVTSAIKMGLENRSSAELLTLTATAATCLRGAAALKLRADVRGSRSTRSINTVEKGATMVVCLPCGRVQLRTVAIFPQHDKVTLKLGKKRLHGTFATYKDYEVLGVEAGTREGEAVATEGARGLFPVTLSTSGGTVRLLLDSQTNCKIWRSSIEALLSDQRLKRVH